MSLTALAVRIATIHALRGRTFAEERVYDSKLNPINLVAKDEKRPVIIVTTDDNNTDITGRGLQTGDHSLELVIEVAVTTKISVDVGDGQTEDVLSIPATDAGLEATISLIGWQIGRALAADGGEWGGLWRVLVTKVKSISSRRGADDENGVRYAARQYIYVIDHLAEPEPGSKPDSADAWGRFLAMMKSENDDLKNLARIIEAEITTGDFLPWEIARGNLGLAKDVSELIGTTPVKIDEAVPLDAVELTDGFTIDKQTAQDADGDG